MAAPEGFDNICETCRDWGRTITREENQDAIRCTDCGRLTWPNLGVNCPAGCAVAFGRSHIRRRDVPMLVAMRDRTLSVEAAEQLVRILDDPNFPTHEGRDLPKADLDFLLKKAAAKAAGPQPDHTV